MTPIRVCSCLVATTLLAFSSNALAEETPPSPAAPPTATSSEVPMPAPTDVQPPPPRARRGGFSGGRLVVEVLGSAALGSLAGYGMFRATGGDGAGPAALGLTTEIAVAPLIVYGLGRAMGGNGSLGSAYYGALFGLSAPGTAAATGDHWTLTMAIGLTLMPVTSALFYEVSSNMRARNAGLALTPTIDPQGHTGIYAGLAFEL